LADTLDLAKTALDDFKAKHQSDFPNIAKSWENNWGELTAYFRYHKAIRRLIIQQIR
jgi:transposase, mutator family